MRWISVVIDKDNVVDKYEKSMNIDIQPVDPMSYTLFAHTQDYKKALPNNNKTTFPPIHP